MVAEDDSNDLLLLDIALTKANIHSSVRILRDGEEVKHYLEGVPPFDDRVAHPVPNLLLLDLKMPRLDGFTVLEWLLWNPELRPRFVAVFTASDNPQDMRRARILGADFYLLKPQDPNELIRIIKALNDYWTTIVSSDHTASPSFSSLSQRQMQPAVF